MAKRIISVTDDGFPCEEYPPSGEITLKYSDGINLELGKSGNPIVTWFESDDTSNNVYVKKFDGTSWGSATV